MTSLMSLMPASTALNETKLASVRSAMTRASVVLPVPGGPQRISDCSVSCSIAQSQRRAGVEQRLLPDDVVERPGAHALGQRGGRRSRPCGVGRVVEEARGVHGALSRASRWRRASKTSRAAARSRRSAIRLAASSGWSPEGRSRRRRLAEARSLRRRRGCASGPVRIGSAMGVPPLTDGCGDTEGHDVGRSPRASSAVREREGPAGGTPIPSTPRTRLPAERIRAACCGDHARCAGGLGRTEKGAKVAGVLDVRPR